MNLKKKKSGIFGKRARLENHSFAVAGTYSGVGVTLFCVNFASFLADRCRNGVAVAELGNNGDFEKLAAQLEDVAGFEWTEYGFRLGKISFFQTGCKDVILYSAKGHFDFTVFDIGTNYVKQEVPFMQCDQKIVLGSHLEWRMCEYENFLEYAEQFEGMRNWEYIDVAGSKTGKVQFIYGRKIKLKKLPRIEEIFVVTEELSRIYQSFL